MGEEKNTKNKYMKNSIGQGEIITVDGKTYKVMDEKNQEKIITAAKKMAIKIGTICLAAGLTVGAIAGRITGEKAGYKAGQKNPDITTSRIVIEMNNSRNRAQNIIDSYNKGENLDNYEITIVDLSNIYNILGTVEEFDKFVRNVSKPGTKGEKFRNIDDVCYTYSLLTRYGEDTLLYPDYSALSNYAKIVAETATNEESKNVGRSH